jgi:hypothetical protein
MRTLALLLVLCALARGEDLDALFARAERDPAAVVPLLVAGSRAVAELEPERAAPLADRLAPFCRRAYFSAERLPGMERIGIHLHRIAERETATGIARRYRIGVELLAALNGRLRLRAGASLKVVDAAAAPLALVVSRSRFRLLAWHGRILAGCFTASLGKPGHETPLGETRILQRVPNPEWRDPDSGHIFQPHDPGNVLGGFWIGFDPLPSRAFRGIGIHGYTAEAPAAWLGTASSHGCVRLAQPDVQEMFAMTVVGTRVVVRE